MSTAKPWYQSKTLWVNLLVVALSIADLLTQYISLPAGTWGLIIGILNILLRAVTGQALALPGRDPLLAGPLDISSDKPTRPTQDEK